MQWFYDLKTVHKINILISTMTFFMLIISITGYYYANESANNIETIYESKLLPIKWLNTIRVHQRANEANLLLLIISDDKKDSDAALKDIRRRAAETEELFKSYSKGKLSDFEKYNLAEFNRVVGTYKQEREKVIDLALKNRREEAFSYFLRIDAIYDDMAGHLRNLAEYNAKQADKIAHKNISEINFAKKFIISLIFISIIASIFIGWLISKRIETILEQITGKMGLMSKGDLRLEKFGQVSKCDLGMLCNSFDRMFENIKNLVKRVATSIEEIASGSEQMNEATEQTALGSQNVADNISIITGSSNGSGIENEENISYINKAIQVMTDNVKSTVNASSETENFAKEGCNLANNAINKINKIKNTAQETSGTIYDLGKLGSEIEIIVDLIKNIAGKTNLLALNAAIEAARAGEYGKGFAVVADEVKKLAEQSADATDKITAMIKDIQEKTGVAVNSIEQEVQIVSEGVDTIHNIENSLVQILEASEKTTENVTEISREITRIYRSSDGVSRAMENISAVTQQQAAGLQEISANTQALSRVAEELKDEIRNFQL